MGVCREVRCGFGEVAVRGLGGLVAMVLAGGVGDECRREHRECRL